ncbi:MAG TPA: hypothetical protein VND83_02505 [Acidimicrobiales bacterium]|nr:hypothetical protein [Acidimicrobiales bacterium]
MTSIVDEPTNTGAVAQDRRGSWVPNGSMILTRIMELRKRRGVMIMLAAVLIGFPAIFLTIRLILHATDPKTYGPAGGYDVYTAMVAGVLYVFGFIVAATLGATAGSSDLGDGMFRHLVITGRSRLAIYLARIPAGLAILVPMVAAGFAIVCAVCVFAAPTQLNYQGVIVPVGLSEPGLESWAAQHAELVVCAFPSRDVRVALPCYVNNGHIHIVHKFPPGVTPPPKPTAAQLQVAARKIAAQDYVDYKQTFLYPPNSLMIKSGLWLELEAAIAFLVGLGLASLMGQRTVVVVLMIILEVILTPIASHRIIPHFLNVQRAVLGVATARVEPRGLPTVFSNGGVHGRAVNESVTVAVVVMLSWVVVWSVLGAWRMMKRDA